MDKDEMNLTDNPPITASGLASWITNARDAGMSEADIMKHVADFSERMGGPAADMDDLPDDVAQHVLGDKLFNHKYDKAARQIHRRFGGLWRDIFDGLPTNRTGYDCRAYMVSLGEAEVAMLYLAEQFGITDPHHNWPAVVGRIQRSIDLWACEDKKWPKYDPDAILRKPIAVDITEDDLRAVGKAVERTQHPGHAARTARDLDTLLRGGMIELDDAAGRAPDSGPIIVKFLRRFKHHLKNAADARRDDCRAGCENADVRRREAAFLVELSCYIDTAWDEAIDVFAVPKDDVHIPAPPHDWNYGYKRHE